MYEPIGRDKCLFLLSRYGHSKWIQELSHSNILTSFQKQPLYDKNPGGGDFLHHARFLKAISCVAKRLNNKFWNSYVLPISRLDGWGESRRPSVVTVFDSIYRCWLFLTIVSLLTVCDCFWPILIIIDHWWPLLTSFDLFCDFFFGHFDSFWHLTIFGRISHTYKRDECWPYAAFFSRIKLQ